MHSVSFEILMPLDNDVNKERLELVVNISKYKNNKIKIYVFMLTIYIAYPTKLSMV